MTRIVEDWFKRRSYAHFDLPLNKTAAVLLATNPARVAKHGFQPLVLIPRKAVKRTRLPDGSINFTTKVRPVGYVGHSDAAIHSYYSSIIRERLEDFYATSPVDSCVLAYRRLNGRCNVHFAHEAFETVRRFGSCDVVALDIKGFFDSLNPSYLKRRWKDLLGVGELNEDHYAVFKSVTQDSAISRGSLRDALGPVVARHRGRSNQRICEFNQFRERVKPRLTPRYALVAKLKGDPAESRKGIAQGTPISATLANLYMLEIDRILYQLATEAGGSYRRYSDDLLFVVPEGFGQHVENEAFSVIQQSGLTIQASKTERTRFAQVGCHQHCIEMSQQWNVTSSTRLNYLGFSFDGRHARIRESTICSWDQKIQGLIRRAYFAADKRRESRIKRRQIYAKYSKHGWGSVYGNWSGRNDPPDDVPRMALGRYLGLAQRLMESEQLDRQARQLENRLHRFIQRETAKL